MPLKEELEVVQQHMEHENEENTRDKLRQQNIINAKKQIDILLEHQNIRLKNKKRFWTISIVLLWRRLHSAQLKACVSGNALHFPGKRGQKSNELPKKLQQNSGPGLQH